jgi:hypothetical protein
MAPVKIYWLVRIMTRIKQARTRAAGYRGSLNTQDFAPKVPTPAERLANVRSAAQVAGCMIRIWGTDTEAQRAAIAALELVESEAIQ